jgi:penicillin-binding protein 1A
MEQHGKQKPDNVWEKTRFCFRAAQRFVGRIVRQAFPAPKPIANPRDGGFFYWLAKYYTFGVLCLLAHVGVALIWVYGQFARTLPPPPTPETYRDHAPTITRIVGGDGRALAELAVEHRDWADISQIPPLLQKAFIAVEDRRFRQHDGIDWKGIMRAAWTNIQAGRIRQGGSTITQQVAKAWLGRQRTLTRKIREAILARRLENALSKAQILELYLNRIFLGHGAYGVKAAAKRYFQKQMKDLTPAEAAMIAGLAQAPSRYSPLAHPKRAIRRRNFVLEKMVEIGALDRAQAKKAAQQPLGLEPKKNNFRNVSPYFAEQVRRDLVALLGHKQWNQGQRCEGEPAWKNLTAAQRRQRCIASLGEKALYRGGYTVETTVDTWVQSVARKHVDQLARWMDKRQGWRGPEAYLPQPKQQRAFVEKSRRRYGDGPLKPGRRYLGLVEKVAPGGALVRVGPRTYTLPLSAMTWAARYTSRRGGVTDRGIRRAWRALMEGDVIWVQLLKSAGPLPQKQILRNGKLDTGSHIEPPAAWPDAPLLALEQTPKVQSALLTFDHQTGYVVSMVGGTDYDRSPFNRTTQACRQPGSTYKPVYYSLALNRGWRFDRKIKDTPYSIIDPKTGKKWYVRDFAYNEDLKKKYAHLVKDYQVTLEFALVWSKNNASVQVFKAMGAENVKRWARRLGFTTPIIADDALALGASCTRMDELSRAFAIFARNGRWLDLVTIRRVIDRDGSVLLDNSVYADPRLTAADKLDRLAATVDRKARQAIPAKTAYRTSKLLRRMVQRGHAEAVRQTKIPTAGKTGTSSRTSDTWFVGYNSRWLTSAWLGDDDYTRPLGRHDASFNTALPLWARYMLEAVGDMPLREVPWQTPKGKQLYPQGSTPQQAGRPPPYTAPFKRMQSRQSRLKAALKYGANGVNGAQEETE